MQKQMMSKKNNQIKFIAPALKLWQKDLFNSIVEAGPSAGKVFVVKSMRQIGKSFAVNIILLYHALTYKKSNSILVSITYKNCSKMFEEICEGLEGFPGLESIDKMNMSIKFTNGSTISYMSAMSRENLRGYTIKRGGLLCIDEAAYLSEDIFGIVFPFVNVSNANILMVSTPRLKQGSFYDYYTAGFDDNVTNVHSFNWSTYDVSELLTDERVDMYRKLLPHSQFVSEVLGDFVDDISGVFDLKDVWYSAPRFPMQGSYSDVFIGIDFATGKFQDYTAISGFNAKGEQILLEYFNDKKPEEQLTYIYDILSQLDKDKIRGINCETNSIGSVYIDRLKSMMPKYPIKEFTTSNSSKREIIEYLSSRCGQKNIKLIDDAEQYAQMAAYQMQITRSGAVTYNSIGEHDDLCMANAMALKLIKDKEKSGGYSITSKPERKYKNLLRVRYGN